MTANFSIVNIFVSTSLVFWLGYLIGQLDGRYWESRKHRREQKVREG